jgi:putative membrane protein
MKLIAKFIIALIANGLGLVATAYLAEGFVISREPKSFLVVVLILTLANIFIRPIAKLILSPLIIITLGLFTLVINAGILYAIDIYFTEITISGLLALVIGTLVISVTNAILKFLAKIL